MEPESQEQLDLEIKRLERDRRREEVKQLRASRTIKWLTPTVLVARQDEPKQPVAAEARPQAPAPPPPAAVPPAPPLQPPVEAKAAPKPVVDSPRMRKPPASASLPARSATVAPANALIWTGSIGPPTNAIDDPPR